MTERFLDQILKHDFVNSDGLEGRIDRLAKALCKESLAEQLECVHDILYRKGGDPCSENQDAALVLATKLVENVQSKLLELVHKVLGYEDSTADSFIREGTAWDTKRIYRIRNGQYWSPC